MGKRFGRRGRVRRKMRGLRRRVKRGMRRVKKLNYPRLSRGGFRL